MKEWECAQVEHHKDVGRTIKEREKDGWCLHTYTCSLLTEHWGWQINHYLLFER